MARRNLLPASLRFFLADLFHVIQELQEHDPGEHGQAVEVAVQALVLAHDVAAGLDEAPELLGGGGGGLSGFHFRVPQKDSPGRAKRKKGGAIIKERIFTPPTPPF